MTERPLTTTPQPEKYEDCGSDIGSHETLLSCPPDAPLLDIPDMEDDLQAFLDEMKRVRRAIEDGHSVVDMIRDIESVTNVSDIEDRLQPCLDKMKRVRRAIEDGHSVAYRMRHIESVAKLLDPEAYAVSMMDSISRGLYMYWKEGRTPPAPDWNTIVKPCTTNTVKQKKYIMWAKCLNKMYRREGLTKDHAYGFAVNCPAYLPLLKAIKRVEAATIDAYDGQEGVDALECAERKVMTMLIKLLRRKRQRVNEFMKEWNKESFRLEAALRARLALLTSADMVKLSRYAGAP